MLLPGSLWGKAARTRWLEATRSGAQGQEYVLQTAAVFNTTEEKFLVVAYQLSGSDSVAWELQRKSSAGDWQLLLSDSGPHAHGTLWQNASVVVPAGTVGLRLLANVTNELDTVRIDSIVAADLPRNWEDVDITCGFESGFLQLVHDRHAATMAATFWAYPLDRDRPGDWPLVKKMFFCFCDSKSFHDMAVIKLRCPT